MLSIRLIYRKMIKVGDDMKRIVSFALILALAGVLFASCGKTSDTDLNPGHTVAPADLGETYNFSIRWGVLGQSSYNSKTGVLIKTTAVIDRSPDDYKTTLILSEEQHEYVSKILQKLGYAEYPDEFDPYLTEDGQTIRSSPSDTIILTVGLKTISCVDISLFGTPGTERGARFIDAVDKIIEMITSSDAWRSLPDYEVLYD